MLRIQCKNSVNNNQGNKSPLGHSYPFKASLDILTQLKQKRVTFYKEEVTKSLTEIKEKTNKKLEKINKTLKESHNKTKIVEVN